jgi:hypothetical protein
MTERSLTVASHVDVAEEVVHFREEFIIGELIAG